MIRCPSCKAENNYRYDGLFIECRACRYRQWAKEIGGKLENVRALWQVEERSNPKAKYG